MIIVPLLLLMTLLIHFSPPRFLYKLLDIVDLPTEAKFMVLLLGVLHLAASMLFENFLQPVLASLIGKWSLSREYVSDVEAGDGTALMTEHSPLIPRAAYGKKITPSKIHKWKRTGKLYKALNLEMNKWM